MQLMRRQRRQMPETQKPAAVCLGALPASLLGAHLSDRVQARSLKILMAVVLLAVGARMAVAGE